MISSRPTARPGSPATAYVDLGAIDVPTYVLAAREDHIVPWRGACGSTRLVRGADRFVLAESGHVAGVVNAPTANRRGFWHGPAHLEGTPLPVVPRLYQNEPNPFNPVTTFRYSLPQAGHVRLDVYDQRGARPGEVAL